MCTTEGCDRPVYIRKRGLCRQHYREQRRRNPCRIEGCTNRATRGTLCSTCKQAGRTYPRIGEAPASATPCSYQVAHNRVRRIRGLPSEHDCITCGQPAEDWAYRNHSEHEITGTVTSGRRGQRYTYTVSWSPYIYDYDPMCKAHHRERDALMTAA